MSDTDLFEAIVGTAEIMGKELSMAGAKMLAHDLATYPAPVVIKALGRCRLELRTFPTVADIIARIDDGRPGVEEAWAMIPKDESASVVWSDEMAGAYAVARSLIDEDEVAARMAFKESYQRLVADARAERRPAKWSPSLGHDPRGRQQALQDAVERGRLSQDHAQALLPGQPISPKVAALIGNAAKRLT